MLLYSKSTNTDVDRGLYTIVYVHAYCLSYHDLLYLLSRRSCPVAGVEGPQDHSDPSAQLEGEPDCYQDHGVPIAQVKRCVPRGIFTN